MCLLARTRWCCLGWTMPAMTVICGWLPPRALWQRPRPPQQRQPLRHRRPQRLQRPHLLRQQLVRRRTATVAAHPAVIALIRHQPQRQRQHQQRRRRQFQRQQPLRRQRRRATVAADLAVIARMTCRCFSVLTRAVTKNWAYWAMLITNRKKEGTRLMIWC